jgi:hypothetical protein
MQAYAMNCPMRNLHRALSTILIALLFAGCGGTDRRRPVTRSATNTPPFIELRSSVSAGTLHFPRGLYSLESQDQNGFYYRAPGKVYQHSFGGSYRHEGGIFVSKRDRRKLRGYVIMAGGLTHVGNLSRADYEYRY